MKLWTASVATLLLAASGAAWSQQTEEQVSPQDAAKVAVGTCAICHGPQGNSQSAQFPKLAGQQEKYLETQLKAFRGQTRGDPDAVAYMWGMASPLSDGMIAALAKYYASQKPAAGRPGDPAVVSKGEQIYRNGVPAENIPACAACHGANGEGNADFPRLAGQHAPYLIKQLYSFRNSMRNMAVMHGVAAEMKQNEMEAVAAYLQSR